MKSRQWLVTLCCAMFTGSMASGADDFRIVAISGQPAVGAPAGTLFERFGGPLSIDRHGNVLFAGHFGAGPRGTPTPTGLWTEAGASGLQLVAHSGDPAAGAPAGIVFAHSSSFMARFNSDGNVAFRGLLTGGDASTGNNVGMWNWRANQQTLITRTGAPAPSTSGVFNSFFDSPFAVGADEAVFEAYISGAGVTPLNNRGIWVTDASNLNLLLRLGSQLPGAEPGVNVSNFSSRVTHTGGMALWAAIEGPGVMGGAAQSLWSRSGAQFERVAQTGMPAPGAAAPFTELVPPNVNEDGDMVFLGELSAPSNASTGLWAGNAHGLRLVARQGDLAPGTSERFGEFNRNMIRECFINNRDEVAFRGRLENVATNTEDGIWKETGGDLKLVVREGSPAPGVAEANFVVLGGLALNNHGSVAFGAFISGAGVPAPGVAGIWAQDRHDNLKLIARVGDSIDVDHGPGVDERTLSSLSLSSLAGSADAGGISAFNDRGELAFWAHFTDGTQAVVVSNVVAVPEPAASTWIVAAMVALFTRQLAKAGRSMSPVA